LTPLGTPGDTHPVSAIGAPQVDFILGPQQMPPQGARALVGALLRGGGGGPAVSAVLIAPDPRNHELVFTNGGGESAVDLRAVWSTRRGLLSYTLGAQVAPGASLTVRVDPDIDDAGVFRCVWGCRDSKRRQHLWSYDGRHRRFRSRKTIRAGEWFPMMYPDSS
jgi:hypothetical protein